MIPVPDPTPHECVDESHAHLNCQSLAVLKESLVLLTYRLEHDIKSLAIWMMDDFTGANYKGPWTKHLTLRVHEKDFYFPELFWKSKSDELVILTGDR